MRRSGPAGRDDEALLRDDTADARDVGDEACERLADARDLAARKRDLLAAAVADREQVELDRSTASP